MQVIDGDTVHDNEDMIVGYVFVQPNTDGCRLTIEHIKPKSKMITRLRIVRDSKEGNLAIPYLVGADPHHEITVIALGEFDRAQWFRKFAYEVLVKADSSERARNWDNEHGQYGLIVKRDFGVIDFPNDGVKERYLEGRLEAIEAQNARAKERGDATVVFEGKCKDDKRLIEAVEAFIKRTLPRPDVKNMPPLHSGGIKLYYNGVPRIYHIRAIGTAGRIDGNIGQLEINAQSDNQYYFKVLRYGSYGIDWLDGDYPAIREFFDWLANELRKNYGERAVAEPTASAATTQAQNAKQAASTEQKSKKGGRPRNTDDEWARQQVHKLGRSKQEVFPEWKKRIGERAKLLADVNDSFDKVIGKKPKKGE